MSEAIDRELLLTRKRLLSQEQNLSATEEVLEKALEKNSLALATIARKRIVRQKAEILQTKQVLAELMSVSSQVDVESVAAPGRGRRAQ